MSDEQNKKQGLKMIELILNLIDQKLTNENLYNYIKDNLIDMIKRNKFSFIDIKNNGITIHNDIWNSIFSIYFEPELSNFNIIKTELICFNNRKKETKKISYDLGTIELDETETMTSINDDKQITEVTLEHNRKIYENDFLTHISSFKSNVVMNEIYRYSSVEEEETFISINRSAVKRSIRTGDVDSYFTKGVEYSKTDDYEVAPFNNRQNNDHLYILYMDSATEQEFNDFVDKFSNPIVVEGHELIKEK